MTEAFQAGDILADIYRVESSLGGGGMGCVYDVTHLRLNRREVLKLIKPQYTAYPDASARFLREARAAAGIECEHVVKVYHSGVLDTGEPFIAMEHLHGEDLGKILDREGLLPVEKAVGYARQACAGLAEAHAKGLVHRDVKPSNLFLAWREGGEPQINCLDFGLVKAVSPAAGTTTLTEPGHIMGTPQYMSPEQIRAAEEPDARADVWALGVVLYELVTGRRPFGGANKLQIFQSVLTRRPEPPSAYAPDLPRALEEVILRCLDKDRAERYTDAGALRDALAPFETSPRPAATVVAGKRRWAGHAAMIGAAMLAGLGLANLVLGSPRPAPEPAPAPALVPTPTATATAVEAPVPTNTSQAVATAPPPPTSPPRICLRGGMRVACPPR